MKLSIFPTYFLMATLLQVQLKVILIEISWQEILGNSIFFNGAKIRWKTKKIWQNLSKSAKLGEKQRTFGKHFVQNISPKSYEVSIFVRNSMSKFECPNFEGTRFLVITASSLYKNELAVQGNPSVFSKDFDEAFLCIKAYF